MRTEAEGQKGRRAERDETDGAEGQKGRRAERQQGRRAAGTDDGTEAARSKAGITSKAAKFH